MTKMLLANFTMPFVDAVIKTLHIQYGTKAVLSRPYLKSEDPPKSSMEADLALVMQLKGSTFSGHFSISFPGLMFKQMVARVFGEDLSLSYTKQGAKALDIGHMIFTSVQGASGEQNFRMEKGPSFFVTGKNLHLRCTNDDETMILPFQTEFGPFQVELSFHSHRTKS